MRIGEVIGKVTLSRSEPEMSGGRFLIVRPNDCASLRAGQRGSGEVVICYDQLGAGKGHQVSFSEGREAACPFHPGRVAVDAYVAALLDKITYGDEADQGDQS